MGQPIARIGDRTQGTCFHPSHPPLDIGGTIITGSPNVFTNNIPTARLGDLVETDCGHIGKIITGSTVDITNELLTARIGDVIDTDAPYKAVIVTGSTDVAGDPQATAEEQANAIGNVVAQAMGFEKVTLDPVEAADIIIGRKIERDNGVDPDTTEAVEYGDGGIPTARRGNESPVLTGGSTGVTNTAGPQPAPASAAVVNAPADAAIEEVPSKQPSNADGQFVKWLPHVDSRVKPQVVTGLERVSRVMGFQLTCTSGYRSPAYNSKVGGSKKSQHMLGNAVDIVQTGLTTAQRQQFIQAAIDAGFTAIGIYNTFTHIDIRGAKVAWGANGSRTGLPKYPWAQQILGANGYATR